MRYNFIEGTYSNIPARVVSYAQGPMKNDIENAQGKGDE